MQNNLCCNFTDLLLLRFSPYHENFKGFVLKALLSTLGQISGSLVKSVKITIKSNSSANNHSEMTV